MRVGQIIEALDFPEARKPAYRLKIDFGPEIGMKNSSAQLTRRYQKEELVSRKILAVVNFPPKQVANFVSEVLVLGVDDGAGGIGTSLHGKFRGFSSGISSLLISNEAGTDPPRPPKLRSRLPDCGPFCNPGPVESLQLSHSFLRCGNRPRSHPPSRAHSLFREAH